MEFQWWTLWHFLLGVIHLSLGIWVFTDEDILTGIDKSSTSIGVFRPRRTKDNSTLGEQEFAIERSYEEWFTASPIAIHGLVAVLTGISHFWSVWIRGFQGEKLGVKVSRPNGWRWFEYSITATLMTMSGFVALGGKDFGMYLLIGVMGVTIQYCGFFLERGPESVKDSWRLRNGQINNFFQYVVACFHPDGETSTKINSERKEIKMKDKSMYQGWWHKYMFIGVLLQLGLTLNLIYLTAIFENIDDASGIEESAIFYAIYYFFFPFLSLLDVFYRDNPNWSFQRVDETYVILSFTSRLPFF